MAMGFMARREATHHEQDEGTSVPCLHDTAFLVFHRCGLLTIRRRYPTTEASTPDASLWLSSLPSTPRSPAARAATPKT